MWFPASSVFEHLHEECIFVANIDGSGPPPNVAWEMPPAVLPPGPHKLILHLLADQSVDHLLEVAIAPKKTYRPHAEEEDGKLYVWITEHLHPMPAFDDGILLAGKAPPQ